MKKYRNILIIFLCIFFSSCEAEWIMDLDINEDESGKYSISILLDQEAQIFAIETGQTEIGGLESIIDSLPEGFGSTVYQKDKMFGIMIRNSFNSFDEFEQQLDTLLSDENTTLLLLPIKEPYILCIEKILSKRINTYIPPYSRLVHQHVYSFLTQKEDIYFSFFVYLFLIHI